MNSFWKHLYSSYKSVHFQQTIFMCYRHNGGQMTHPHNGLRLPLTDHLGCFLQTLTCHPLTSQVSADRGSEKSWETELTLPPRPKHSKQLCCNNQITKEPMWDEEKSLGWGKVLLAETLWTALKFFNILLSTVYNKCTKGTKGYNQMHYCILRALTTKALKI